MLFTTSYIIIILIFVSMNTSIAYSDRSPLKQQQQQHKPTTRSPTIIEATTISNQINDEVQQHPTTTMYTIHEINPTEPIDISSLVGFGNKLVDDGEPEFTLECPLRSLIILKSEYAKKKDRRKWFDLIKSSISATWYKNEQIFWRDNGNKVIRYDKHTLAMFQLRPSDSGRYSCLIDHSGAPPELAKYFKFEKGAYFTLTVSGPDLPDSKPAITHPPDNIYTPRGSNATFTCNRTETLSNQITRWFRSCPFGENYTCVEEFLAAFDNATREDDPRILSDYFIDGQRDDTLTLYNLTEDQSGFYGCAVTNIKGSDIRLAQLHLNDDSPRIQGLLNIAPNSERYNSGLGWSVIIIGSLVATVAVLLVAVYFLNLTIRKDKRMKNPLISQATGNNNSNKCTGVITNCSNREANLRQHLPTIDCPDIYNIGKTADGFISGHLHQDTGHLLSQSICKNILNKKQSPSISSTNSHHSDEATCSWAKSMSSNSDNCRAFYSHTSNTTATTVPMYDHPPSTGTLLRPCRFIVQDACVSNPTYGFLRPENDATDWAFPRRNLDRLDKIGEGQFGEVWRYVARRKDGSGDIVAVKQLRNRAGLGDREHLELIAEIEIMKSVNDHPNVIKLLHYCIDDTGPILVIMEYAENGKLQTYLRNCRASSKSSRERCNIEKTYPNITSKELIKFTYHIAKGMEYIASKGIVHRDLASRNILVSSDRICKVADFGFARRVNDDSAYERTTANPVPVKWMAPEALVENKFTSKSDVFSLGILMWEIVTLGATPYEQLTSEGVYKKVTTGGRLDRPSHCRDEFYSLMADCWQHDPTKRPSFKEVACQLETLLLSENDYIELDQYPEHSYYNIENMTDEKVVNNII